MFTLLFATASVSLSIATLQRGFSIQEFVTALTSLQIVKCVELRRILISGFKLERVPPLSARFSDFTFQYSFNKLSGTLPFSVLRFLSFIFFADLLVNLPIGRIVSCFHASSLGYYDKDPVAGAANVVDEYRNEEGDTVSSN